MILLLNVQIIQHLMESIVNAFPVFILFLQAYVLFVLLELIGMDIVVKLVIMLVQMDIFGTFKKESVCLKISVGTTKYGMELTVDVFKEPFGYKENVKNVNTEPSLMG